jgi:chemotaxis methyl-accepting protein methylase
VTARARIAALLSAHTGIDASRMPAHALDAALGRLEANGLGLRAIEARLAEGADDVLHVLEDATTVGETYFFRHPEQFQAAADHLHTLRKPTLSVWSAGCATGEEAYSLAAVLRHALGADRRVSVLGTDIATRRLEIARRGRYREWSLRRAVRPLAPIVERAGDDYVVTAAVRKDVDFRAHNLLADTSPGGPFDLVFCRNVLIYLRDEAVQAVVGHLARALSPDGRLVLGVLDSRTVRIPDLVAVGPPELQVYARRHAKPQRPSRAPTIVRAPDEPPSLDAAPPPRQTRRPIFGAPRRAPSLPPRAAAPALSSEVHRSILRKIEREELAIARTALMELLERDPAYVPAHLELGLLELRVGRHAAATKAMVKVLGMLEHSSAELMLDGPEQAPVAFYRSVAEGVLAQAGAKR